MGSYFLRLKSAYVVRHSLTSTMHFKQITAVLAGLLPITIAAQQPLPTKFAPRPTTGAITPTDLMTRVYAFADDSMMGRHSGTVHHDKATDYIARELTRLGLKPGGDSGTFFQQLPVATRTLAEGSKITVDGRDFLP